MFLRERHMIAYTRRRVKLVAVAPIDICSKGSYNDYERYNYRDTGPVHDQPQSGVYLLIYFTFSRTRYGDAAISSIRVSFLSSEHHYNVQSNLEWNSEGVMDDESGESIEREVRVAGRGEEYKVTMEIGQSRCVQLYLAEGSYSPQTRMYSSRWWGPRMEESRVK